MEVHSIKNWRVVQKSGISNSLSQWRKRETFETEKQNGKAAKNRPWFKRTELGFNPR